METVLGIGGFFFRAKDPERLGRWYKTNFGVGMAPSQYKDPPWRQNGGMTVFGPLPQDDGQFGARGKGWIINFRVRDLEAIVAQLRGGGTKVAVDEEEYPMGRFATLKDPEGNSIQLWQLRGSDLKMEEARPRSRSRKPKARRGKSG